MSEAKKKGLFARLREGLSKTRGNMTEKVDDMVRENRKIDEDFYEELEEILIMGDIGVRATTEIIERLKAEVKKQHIKEPAECKQLLIDSIKEQMYVEAAKVQGASNFRILWKLILPGVISPLTVQASFIFAQAIISEASLSFLGAGIPAPAASWGNILQASKQVISKAPWTAIFPGACVILCVLSLNLLGDGLRDYLDPKTAKGRKK